MTVEASSVPGVFASVCPSRQNDRWVSHPHSLCRSRPAGPETFCIRSGVPSEQGQGRDPKPGRLLPGPLPLCAAVTFVLRVWHPHIRAGAAGWLRLWGGQRCDPRSPGASFLMSAAMTVTGWDAPRGECFAHSRCPVRVCRPACSRPPPSSSPPASAGFLSSATRGTSERGLRDGEPRFRGPKGHAPGAGRRVCGVPRAEVPQGCSERRGGGAWASMAGPRLPRSSAPRRCRSCLLTARRRPRVRCRVLRAFRVRPV